MRTVPCLIPSPPTILTSDTTMKINLSLSAPAEVEAECLVAVLLDRSEKDRSEKDGSQKTRAIAKPQLSIETGDRAFKQLPPK